MQTQRPRKEYELTNEGKNLLNYTENTLNLICKNMVMDNKIQIQIAPQTLIR